ncbi:hypothetical protein B296_00018145, partial [Ensete ventricosum]
RSASLDRVSTGASRRITFPFLDGVLEILTFLLCTRVSVSSILDEGRRGMAGGAAAISSSSRCLRGAEEKDLEVKLRRIMTNVPVPVSNTSGNSAGSGSGDFHQVSPPPFLSTDEEDRLCRMYADYQRRKEAAEFNMRRLKAAEESTAKKRQQRKKEKKNKPSNGAPKEDSSEDEASDDGDELHK